MSLGLHDWVPCLLHRLILFLKVCRSYESLYIGIQVEVHFQTRSSYNGDKAEFELLEVGCRGRNGENRSPTKTWEGIYVFFIYLEKRFFVFYSYS